MASVDEVVETKLAELRDAGLRATDDPRKAAGMAPCVLIVPVPDLAFSLLDGRHAEATFSAVCLGKTPGGRDTARKITALVAVAAQVLEAENATPDTYYLTADTPYPAYLIEFEADVELPDLTEGETP